MCIYIMHTYMQHFIQMYLHLFRSALQIITTVSHEKTALLYIKITSKYQFGVKLSCLALQG